MIRFVVEVACMKCNGKAQTTAPADSFPPEAHECVPKGWEYRRRYEWFKEKTGALCWLCLDTEKRESAAEKRKAEEREQKRVERNAKAREHRKAKAC
jgi:hypothetical protein